MAKGNSSEALMRQRAELHEAMEGALKSLRQAVPQVIRDTENALVAFALSVAQKLVSDMPISVGMVEAAVRDAVAQVESAPHFTVRLHPADLELLQKAVRLCWVHRMMGAISGFFLRRT